MMMDKSTEANVDCSGLVNEPHPTPHPGKCMKNTAINYR